jgi:tRNA/rRNA methyltransferase
MNLGQAVALCLYEVARMSGKMPAAEKVKPAAANDFERLAAALLEILRACGYVSPAGDQLAEDKIRRFVHRQNLSAEDATLWLGMLRQIMWKMKSSNK